MKYSLRWRSWLQAMVQPEPNPALEAALQQHRASLPVLWLLGKTGAGKSSIIQRLTGDTRVQIGNGYAPCTGSARFYDHPSSAPVLRFLETRGLGEAQYDPAVDLAAARGGSHALLIVTRVDDPAQTVLVNALRSLKLASNDLTILHIHTALHTLSANELPRATAFNSAQIDKALSRHVPTVSIDFTAPEDGFANPDLGLDDLRESILELVPELTRVLARQEGRDQEESVYLSHRRDIIGYASAAAASDILPVIGLIAVPSLQGKMLYTLAGRYGIAWDKRVATEFVAALGSGFLYRYAISLGGRQLSRLIPVYGQTVGTATTASLSFASTYALGRAACLYMYRRKHRQVMAPESLRETFKQALKEQKTR